MTARAIQQQQAKRQTNITNSQRNSKGIAIQAKLTVGKPNDKYEREADRIADQVMRIPDRATVLRKCAACEEEEKIQQKPLAAGITPWIQRQVAEEQEEDGVQTKLLQRQAEEEEEPVQPKLMLQKQPEEEPLQVKSLASESPTPGASLESRLNGSKSGGRPLPDTTRSFMENRIGADFSKVDIHDNSNAAKMNEQLNARAFTHKSSIYFNRGEYNPSSKKGKKLLAHELTHILQQRPSHQINRDTGKDVHERAKEIRSQHDNLKLETDFVKVALREIKKKKSVRYNRDAVLKRHLPKIATLLGIDLETLKSEWLWLVNNVGQKGFTTKEQLFFSKITKSKISTIRKSFPKSHAHDWIKDTYEEVFDLIIKHADSDITPSQLYAYTSNEGLAKLTKAGKDAGVSGTEFTLSKVYGFNALGLDDFMTDLNAKRKPLTGFLPEGFESKITEDVRTNEKGRTVRSATFPNLDLALQGSMAMLKRRRALFLEDAKNNGYAPPTTDEKVFWTYTYFNPGEFGGKAQLEKYKKGNSRKIKERNLSDWITKGEYPHSQRVLQGYKAVEQMKIFK